MSSGPQAARAGFGGFAWRGGRPAFSASRELELEFGHADTASAEGDTFGFQAEALFEAGLAGESDASAGGDHAVPGKSIRLAQGPDDLAGGAGESSGARDRAVGGNFASRDLQDRGADLGEHGNKFSPRKDKVEARKKVGLC